MHHLLPRLFVLLLSVSASLCLSLDFAGGKLSDLLDKRGPKSEMVLSLSATTFIVASILKVSMRFVEGSRKERPGLERGH